MSHSSKKRITKRVVDTATPNDGREFIVWDDQLVGFGLRIKTSGQKSYFIQYRNKQGISRRYTLGKHGHLTPDKARELAKKQFGRITEGHDPAEEKRLNLREMSVSDLCDLYVHEGCKNKKLTTLTTDKGRIERHIKPLLGNKKISTLKRVDIERMRDDIVNGKTSCDEKTKKRGRAIVRGGKGVASRTVSLLSAVYSFAIRRDLVKDNPCKGVKKFSGRKCDRFLSAQEFQDLGDAIEAAKAKEHPSVINVIQMLALTGCRRSEILTLKWEHIDWDKSCLRLPDSKTGQKVVRMAPPAIKILKEQKRLENNPYVFHGIKKGHYFVGLTKAWDRIKSRKESLHNLRLHDLRHTFASVGIGSGYGLALIGSLLGHSNPMTTSRYAHLADDHIKAANDEISLRISKSMNK